MRGVIDAVSIDDWYDETHQYFDQVRPVVGAIDLARNFLSDSVTV